MGDLSISQVSARPGRIGIRARQMFDGYRFQHGPCWSWSRMVGSARSILLVPPAPI